MKKLTESKTKRRCGRWCVGNRWIDGRVTPVRRSVAVGTWVSRSGPVRHLDRFFGFGIFSGNNLLLQTRMSTVAWIGDEITFYRYAGRRLGECPIFTSFASFFFFTSLSGPATTRFSLLFLHFLDCEQITKTTYTCKLNVFCL